jgi:hypothetical protein
MCVLVLLLSLEKKMRLAKAFHLGWKYYIDSKRAEKHGCMIQKT